MKGAEILKSVIAAIGIDIGKNSLHVVGLDGRGAVALLCHPRRSTA
jgi:hypothetical protein